MKRSDTIIHMPTISDFQQIIDDKNKDIIMLLEALVAIHTHEKPNPEMKPGSQGCRYCTRIAKEAIAAVPSK